MFSLLLFCQCPFTNLCVRCSLYSEKSSNSSPRSQYFFNGSSNYKLRNLHVLCDYLVYYRVFFSKVLHSHDVFSKKETKFMIVEETKTGDNVKSVQ